MFYREVIEMAVDRFRPPRLVRGLDGAHVEPFPQEDTGQIRRPGGAEVHRGDARIHARGEAAFALGYRVWGLQPTFTITQTIAS